MNRKKIQLVKKYTYISCATLSIFLSSRLQAMDSSLDYPIKGGYMRVPRLTKDFKEDLESSNVMGPKTLAESHSSYDWETEPFENKGYKINTPNPEEKALPKKPFSQKAKKFFKKNGLKIISTGISLFRGIVTLVNIIDKN